jgi:uncharacterized protein (DUF305 family)
MPATRAVLTNLAAGALTLGLGACGGSGSTATTMPASSTASVPASVSAMAKASAAVFDGQDVTFSADMIDHHRQAVQMAMLAPKRTTTKAVLTLAKAIEAAQGPEITMMSGWLTSWGKPVPEDMSGMDMGGSMPGMMSMADLDKLAKAKGAAFDKQFLTMMIAHHEGAITMARTQIGKGRSPQAVAMARKVVTDQNAEITTMRALLR